MNLEIFQTITNSSCVHINEVLTLKQFQRLFQMDLRRNSSPLAINFSLQEVLDILRERRDDTRNLSGGVETLLIAVYAVLMGAGLIANCVVSFVVARRTQMHTARNLYIVNLTLSDITLCVVCMPFTLLSLLRRHWTLGGALCKLVPLVQGTNIMVSIGTITVIALDRYFTIVRRCSQDAASTRRRVVISIACIWLLSLLATAPVCFYQDLESFSFHRVVLYDICIETWPSVELKLCYGIGVLLMQAVIPALVVGIVHARIAAYLHAHAQTRHDAVDSRRARREIERNRRTTVLLSGIAVLFAVSWLPIGIFSVVADVTSVSSVSPHNMYVGLAACHVLAMSSAVTNPVVYGWLNSNIRHEFLQLLPNRCATMMQPRAPQQVTLGGATTAVDGDATTRTHVNNHTSVATPPKQQLQHGEAVALLAVPGGTIKPRATNGKECHVENSVL